MLFIVFGGFFVLMTLASTAHDAANCVLLMWRRVRGLCVRGAEQRTGMSCGQCAVIEQRLYLV